ncbi:MAG: PEGA domain-containing protein, partial [Deltaproteobacteria bacterium]
AGARAAGRGEPPGDAAVASGRQVGLVASGRAGDGGRRRPEAGRADDGGAPDSERASRARDAPRRGATAHDRAQRRQPAGGRAGGARRTGRPSERSRRAAAPAAPAPDGYLTVAAQPYATVFVDGRKLGVTPLVRVPLAPGVHQLKAVSSADATVRTFRVQIRSGDTTRRKVEW